MASDLQHLKRTAPERRRGAFVFLFILCAAAGFALRMAVSCELGLANRGLNAVFSPSRASDLATYMRLSLEISQGKIPETFYYQPWYYAVFLPLIRLAGGGVGAVVFCQILCGTAAVVFAGLAGRIFAGKKGALFAAFLCATSVPLVFYTPYHQNETLQSMHLALLFLAGLIALKSGRPLHFALAGIVCGVAICTRGNIILISLLLGVLALIFPRRLKFKAKIINAVLILIMAAAVMMPFALRNTLALKRFCGASTAGDAVLALGNTPEAPAGGRNPGLPAGPMEYPESFHRVMSDASNGVGLGKSMFKWMCREPLAFFELQFRKLLLFWDVREIPNNVSLAGEGRYSKILGAMLFLKFDVLLLLCGFAGFLLAFGVFKLRDYRLWWLCGFITIYWGSIALFYNLARFRAPVLPVLAVSGALLMRRRIRTLFKLLALIFSLFITVFAYDNYRFCEPAVMRVVRPAGTLVYPAIGKTEYDLLDHGPVSFGAWKEVKLENGMRIGKSFSVCQGGKVIWQLYAAEEGTAVVQSDAGIIHTLSLVPGVNHFEYDAPDLRKAGFTVNHVDCRLYAVYDAQRNYCRSMLGDKSISGEWVARCRFVPEQTTGSFD